MATGLGQKQHTRNAPADKRQAIVDAALELFTTVGYEQTTIADVAKKAGVAVGTVYLYFKNKLELLYAARADWETELLRHMGGPEIQQVPHHLRARPMMDAVFRFCQERTESVQLMGVAPEVIGSLYHKEGGSTVRQAIKQFLDEGVALGLFRPIDTGMAALLSYGMVTAALEQCFYVEDGSNQEAYKVALVDGLEHYLVAPDLLAQRDNM